MLTKGEALNALNEAEASRLRAIFSGQIFEGGDAAGAAVEVEEILKVRKTMHDIVCELYPDEQKRS